MKAATGFAGLLLAAAAALAPPVPAQAPPATRTTFFISPQGRDANEGTRPEAPMRTFGRAMDRLAPGDELVLLDGVYSEAEGTGQISYRGRGPGAGGTLSGQIPSGIDLERPTVVRAQNPGRARVEGNLFIGRSDRKDRFIVVDGITFVGGGSLYNTSHVTIRNCGFHGPFSIGTNDHAHGNDHNLVEDVWIWASGSRIIAINYRATHNVWRRVVVRGDGCGTPQCAGGNNPNVGFTVYDSSDVSVQNMLVVDRVLAPGDSPYADFAVAQHSPGRFLFGRNEWLGTISLAAPDSGYYMDPDRGGTLDPTIRISNAIAWDARGAGFNLARSGTNNVLENLTVKAGYDNVRVAPELTSGVLRNVISVDAGRYALNSSYPPSHVAIRGGRSGPYNQARCATACYLQDPLADGQPPSLRYLPRIEEGSALKGKGFQGADIGANVMYRYGRDGARHGDPGYNELGPVPLWPWPNEDRIRKEMCADSGVTRGFCAAGSLTRYVWEYLGNPMPEDPYAKPAAARRAAPEPKRAPAKRPG